MRRRKDPAWWLLKDRAKARGGQLCEWCRLRPVHALHHRHYRTVYHEGLRDVMAVCNPCHKTIHGRRRTRPRMAAGSLAAAGDGGFGLTLVWLKYLAAQRR